MLIYGDRDEDAFAAPTLHLIDALIKANKTFDLLYLPNRDHSFLRFDAYYTRRLWDYFVLHLLGAQPPEKYPLQPLEREVCSLKSIFALPGTACATSRNITSAGLVASMWPVMADCDVLGREDMYMEGCG